eukprot:3999895-Prymnesium_polylepis.1
MRSSFVCISCADRRGTSRGIDVSTTGLLPARRLHKSRTPKPAQEIVAATRTNRRFLDTYWGLIEKFIGFGTGGSPPDRSP